MDAAHWDEAYARLGATGVSWFRAEEGTSLDLMRSVPTPPGSVLDVGGGASGLAASLHALGVPRVSVLDLSERALDMARGQAGEAAGAIEWITTDIRSWVPAGTWDLWHDRAVFHFMVTEADRAGYRRALAAAVPPGGHVIVATFAPDGPEQCSRLPVQRYAAHDLVAALGDDLALVTAQAEVHVTPSGNEQPFTWVLAKRLASSP